MKFDNTLVPYDGSKCAERAFDAALTKFTHSDICLLTCVEPANTSDVRRGEEFVDEAEKKERDWWLAGMENLVERGRKEGIKDARDCTTRWHFFKILKQDNFKTARNKDT